MVAVLLRGGSRAVAVAADDLAQVAATLKRPRQAGFGMQRVVAVLLLSAILAGCFGGNDGPSASGADRAPIIHIQGGTEQDVAAAFAASPYHLQLCDYGYRAVQPASHLEAADDAVAPDGRQCDFRVTKPLLDPTLFDWVHQHGPGNEVSVAVNPVNPRNVAGGAKDYTVSYISDTADCGEYTVWNGHFWSMDGGRTWTNDLVPGFVGDPRESALKGNLCNTDPVSVFDSDGTYWHNGLNYRGAREDVGDPVNPAGNGGLATGSQIFFARSADGGATFDRITFASYGQNDPGIFNDKNWVAVDPLSDHMIHTWTNFYAAAPLIMYVESFDGGALWTHPAPLTPGPSIPGVTGDVPGAVVPTGQFSMPQYDSEGNIWVLWAAVGGAAIAKGTRVGTPEGPQATAFGPAHLAVPLGQLGGSGCLEETDFRASVYPVLGVDTSGGPHDGRLYITWASAGATGAGIFLSHSDDGITWSEPLEVTGHLGDDQFMPWIDVGPDGFVHLAYYDCSMGRDGRTMTLGYTVLHPGGEVSGGSSWVGQASFDGDLGHHQSGVPFIGDYIGVDASCGAAHFFWADTRHGRSDVYSATVLRDTAAMGYYAPELVGPSGASASVPECP